ncbi:MAG: hypothetical protein QNL65_02230 [Opitutales bacterium]|jgi:hypothetical protein|tara:strand:+ start:708 stop:1010 length:303 start_codon:yes stop_codon:yes gene_type:complete
MGIKLKRNNRQFKFTIIKRMDMKLFDIGAKVPQIEKKSTAKNAIARFDSGPARVIRISSRFLVFSFGREIWTGFPQPKMANPGEIKIMIAGSKIEPIGSI